MSASTDTAHRTPPKLAFSKWKSLAALMFGFLGFSAGFLVSLLDVMKSNMETSMLPTTGSDTVTFGKKKANRLTTQTVLMRRLCIAERGIAELCETPACWSGGRVALRC